MKIKTNVEQCAFPNVRLKYIKMRMFFRFLSAYANMAYPSQGDQSGWLRCCFVMLVLFVGQTELRAKKVDVEQACMQAYAFWNKCMPQKGKARCRRVTTGMSPNREAYYVFNNDEGGFVIIAGDDTVRPVLGYTFTGTFKMDSIPDGLRDLLASYERQINTVDDGLDAYDAYGSTAFSFTGERLLNTAKWNQGNPYNKYTPYNYWTGCVATAMAIIMRHHEWPERGDSEHSYIWQGKKLSADFNHVYNWSSMPKRYFTFNTEKFDSVAHLMLELGVAVEMNYAEDGSAASISDAVSSMQRYFRYSRYAEIVRCDNYGDEEWKEKIRGEIDANRPVLYSAADEFRDSGHAFVIDGYKDAMFAVNWGWGGSYDGFYAIGSLNPGNAAYNERQWAVMNLKPSDGQEKIASLCMKKQKDTFCGMNMSVSDVRAGIGFNVWLGRLTSSPVADAFSGDVAVALIGQNGDIKDVIGSYHLKNFKTGHYYSSFMLNCVSNVDAVDGDSLAVMALEDGVPSYVEVLDEEWHTVRLSATGFVPKTFEIEKDLGEGATFVEASSYYNNKRNFYNGKPLLGTTYYFNIKIDKSITKSFVELDGEPVNKTCPNGNAAYYAVATAYKPLYKIKVRTFREYTGKTLSVDVLTPGGLERQLRALNMDYYVYNSIKLSGKVDVRDFYALNKFPFCQIDMRDCEVVAYGSFLSNTIPEYAFLGNCHLDHFVMPKRTERIEKEAFRESGIVEITIPESVAKFEDNAFCCCWKLADVTLCHCVPPTKEINWSVFAGKEEELYRTLHVPAGCKRKYEEDPYAGDLLGTFDAIEEDALTGIHETVSVPGDIGVTYELSGMRVANGAKHCGIIIRGRRKFLNGIGR